MYFKGIRGPTGPKGEPGLGVNVTELTRLLQEEKRGKIYLRYRCKNDNENM